MTIGGAPAAAARDCLLLIGDTADPQFRLVVKSVGSDSKTAVIDISQQPDFAVALAPSGEVTAELSGEPINVSGLWSRIKLPFAAPGRGGPTGMEAVVRTEWVGMEAGLAHLFESVCFNDALLTVGQSKLAQLHRAGRAGFAIPASIAGLSKAAAMRFAVQHPFMVLKALHASRVSHEGVDQVDILISSPLSGSDLSAADSSEFDGCPFFLQERLDNSQEHRVIAFGEFVYCYRVVDAPGVTPLLDRRMMRPEYELVATPHGLRQLITNYFDLVGLTYGVFDLIFESNQIRFLECNPEGQWHSANRINLEEVTNAFAGWLTNKTTASNSTAQIGRIGAYP